MDLFEEVRQRVPVKEAAIKYGFEPDRQGKICCPFHADDHPSLQLYSGGKGWWCYVCDMGGSVIDFAAKLFSLSPRDAALKLNEDFALGLSGETPSSLHRRAINHKRLIQDRERKKFREEYEARQRWFIVLRRELAHTDSGECKGQLLGWMDTLNEWFRENPWR